MKEAEGTARRRDNGEGRGRGPKGAAQPGSAVLRAQVTSEAASREGGGVFYHVPQGREGPGLPHSVAPWGRRLECPMASDQRDKLRELLPMRSPHVSRTGSREREEKHLGHSKEWSEG